MSDEMDPLDYIDADELDPRDPEGLGTCYRCSSDAVVTCDECGAVCCKAHFENVDGALYCDACFDKIPTCPNCGETGGEPRTVTSSEFQGEPGHGGVVTWDDEGCSLCIGVRA